MSDKRYVAAIEISSSKIIAEVGVIHPSGQLDVIACEQEKGVEAVRYGIIQNFEETAIKITRVLERLERKTQVSPRKIRGLFVGLSARSMRSVSTEVSLSLPEEMEINESVIARLKSMALDKVLDNSPELIDAIPRTYRVGNIETTQPIGTFGNHISAKFDLIVCRPEIKRNIVKTLQEKMGLRIDGIVVTALATGQLILTSDEKRLGCMLVDMGAETTTVTIYKNGALLYYATLPLGGRNITRDITTLSVLEENAEDLKQTSGHAIPRDMQTNWNLNGVKMSDLSNLIVSRAEEIVANIVEQVAYAGLTERDLPGGIVVIGGGFRLNDMTELLQNQSGLSVRNGTLPNYVRTTGNAKNMFDAVEVTSVLYSGATNSDVECLELPPAEPLIVTGIPNADDVPEEPEPETPKKPKNNWMGKLAGKMAGKMAGFFKGDEEDDSDLLE